MTLPAARAGTPRSATSAPATTWVGAIDGLRLLAAVGVVTFHMQAESHVSQVVSRTTASLVVPVFASFFVVSGFVLYRPWARAHLAYRPGGTIVSPDGGARAFWLRRAFRVFPLYWTVLAIALLTSSQGSGLHGLGDWLQVIFLSPLPHPDTLLTHGLGLIVWTMVVEIIYYLLLPLYGRGISRLIYGGTSPLVAELAPLTALLGVTAIVSAAVHLSIGAFSIIFAGMLLAVGAAWQVEVGRPVPALRWLALRPAVSVLVVVACWAAGSSVARSDDPKTLFNRHIWLHLGAMLIVSTVIFIPAVFGPERSWVKRALASRGMRVLGALTYGMYLWHYPIERVVHHRVGTGFVALMGTVLPISVGAAFLTNRLVEEPTDRLRHRLFGCTTTRVRDARANGHARARAEPSLPKRRLEIPVDGFDEEHRTDDRDPARRPIRSAGRWCSPVTGFRAIAAVLVVVGHTFLSSRTYPFTGVVHVIGLVVPSFFVISAYALYRPFVVADIRGDPPRSAHSFWWRRLLRIYPLYVVALTAYLLLLPDLRPHGGAILDYLKLYSFLQVYDQHLVAFSGIPAAWFLCDEAAFYLSLPLIAGAARAWTRRAGARTVQERLRSHTVIALGLFLAGPVVRSLLVIHEVPGATSLPISNVDFYGLGILLAVCSVRERAQLGLPAAVDWVRDHARVAWTVTVASLVLLAVVAKKPDQLFEPRETVIRYSLYAIAVLPMMITIMLGDQRASVNRWLSNKRFLLLGALSLHIYLWHQLLLGAFDRYVHEIANLGGSRFTTATLLCAVMVACTVALSAALRPILDAPYHRWSNRFERRPRRPQTGSATQTPLPAPRRSAPRRFPPRGAPAVR